MKEYSKEQIIEEFGKAGWPTVVLIDKVRYLSGLEFIDKHSEERKIDASKFYLHLYKHSKGLVMNFDIGLSTYRTGLQPDKIKYFVIEQQQQILNQNNKSVVGRALVGGLLLGPLGAVVGAMSGIGASNAKLTDYPDNILTICIDDDGKEDFLLFSVSNKNFKDVEKFLKSNFPKQYKNFNEIIKDEPKIQSNNVSAADEIKKLKELLDLGILTQVEFDEQKVKMLNR